MSSILLRSFVTDELQHLTPFAGPLCGQLVALKEGRRNDRKNGIVRESFSEKADCFELIEVGFIELVEAVWRKVRENASDCRNVSEIFIFVQNGNGFEWDIIDVKSVNPGVASAGVFWPRKGCDNVGFHFLLLSI